MESNSLASGRTTVTLRDFMSQCHDLLKQQQELSQFVSLVSSSSPVVATTKTKPPAATGDDDEENNNSDEPKQKKSKILSPPPEDQNDPFDCSDMAVPSVFDHVDELLESSWVPWWRHLDQRKISVASLDKKQPSSSADAVEKDDDYEGSDTLPNSQTNEDSGVNRQKESGGASAAAAAAGTSSKKTTWWFDKHVRLPENFDYANQRDEPPSPSPQPGEDRVISLEDPTQTLSYQHELWHLFDNVPTSLQIQNELHQGMALTHTRALHESISKQVAAADTSVADDFGLYALRMRDRHDAIPRPPASLLALDSSNEKQSPSIFGTIVMEFWKRPWNDRAQSTPDPSRMVLEFQGSQTLLDVHNAIVALRQDDFWNQHVLVDRKNSSNDDALPQQQQHLEHHTANIVEGGRECSEDGVVEENAKSTPQQQPLERDTARVLEGGGECSEIGLKEDSGFFFVEGTFYITGNRGEDHVQPILTWLQSGTERQQIDRYQHLGLLSARSLVKKKRTSLPLPEVQNMSDIHLESLPVRLGIRYAHVHHGDVECSLFVVDFQSHSDHPAAVAATTTTTTTTTTTPYPIIHDIWTRSAVAPSECEACQTRLATLVTSTVCRLTDGHKALCGVCAREFHIPREELQKESIWQAGRHGD